MRWKQPIDTGLLELCMGNKFATSVMVILIYRSANKDKFIYPEDGPPILLKKSQCFCGRFELADCFGLDRGQSGRIRRILDFLQNSAKLITKRKSRNGSIISILNYDSLTQFDQTDSQSTANQQPINSHKQECKDIKSKKKKDIQRTKKEVPDPQVKIFIDYFFLAYKKAFGQRTNPPFVGGRDGKTIKRLLARWNLDHLKTNVTRYLKTPNKFFRENGYDLTRYEVFLNASQVGAHGDDSRPTEVVL